MAAQLDQATRNAVIAEANARAQRFGISPEQALYNYARENNISNSDVDAYMGLGAGATDNWVKQRDAGMAAQPIAPQVQQPAPQGNSYTAPTSANLGLGGVQALRADHRAAVVAEATRRAQSNGTTPEDELYRYAQGNKISNSDVDKYMGFQSGATDNWAKQRGGYQGSNLGMGGYNPQQNPYLGQMGRDIGNQMFDNWSRTQMPSIRSGAMAAGGFGGSRQGVVEANGFNDMNRQYGQALTSMYGNDWSQQQGRNLQQQGLNNSYDLGLRSNDLQNRSVNNSYDLGLRASDLGFANLDANIAQNNFGNQMQAANFGLGVNNTLNNQTQQGIQAGTNIQNTPLDYQKYFSGSANAAGGNGGTGTSSTNAYSNPYVGALGGAQLGNAWQYPRT